MAKLGLDTLAAAASIEDADLLLALKDGETNVKKVTAGVALAAYYKKTEIDAKVSASAYGIKYSWTDNTAMLAQAGMLDLEQGLDQDLRKVFQYNGTDWIFMYDLDAGDTVLTTDAEYTEMLADIAFSKTFNASKIILVGSADFLTITDAMDFTKDYKGEYFTIQLPDGTHEYTPETNRYVYENNIRFESVSSIKANCILSILGTGSGSADDYMNFEGDIEFNYMTLHNPGGTGNDAWMLLRFYGNHNVFYNVDLGNIVVIGYQQAHIQSTVVNRVPGAEISIWIYENSFLEILGSNLFNTDITLKNSSTIYCDTVVMGGEDAGNFFTIAEGNITLFEDSRLLLQHTTSLTIQNTNLGVQVLEGSKVNRAQEIIWDNVTTPYNIPVNKMNADGSLIIDLDEGGFEANPYTDAEKVVVSNTFGTNSGDETKASIDILGINASTVNSLTVETSVPLGALFTDTDTDTIYDGLTAVDLLTLNPSTTPVGNNTFFVDSADSLLKFKDNAGTIQTINFV